MAVLLKNENLVLVWALLHYVSPILFFVFSKLSSFQLKPRTLRTNFFSYFIIFQCVYIVLARLTFFDGSIWGLSNFLFLGVPLITAVYFFFQKDAFIWFYTLFSVGTVIYYILNIFEPRMSVGLNLNVIIEHLLILILYFWHLNKNYKEELSRSYNSLKFWALDFDKKEAFWALFPVMVFVAVWLIIFVIIAFKFRNVIFAKFRS